MPGHRIRAVLAGLASLGCMIAGAGLAWAHPLWPAGLTILFAAVVVWMAWRPAHLLLVLPAGLPWLDFSPWTGRLAVSEFDLLVLACAAGSLGHLARDPSTGPADRAAGAATFAGRAPRTPGVAATVLLLASSVALVRGVADAGGGPVSWWPAYDDVTRVLVQFKPLLWMLLLLAPVRRLLRVAPEQHARQFCLGMCLGAAVLVLAVLWERAAMPGLGDFSKPYRAVGLFWEMHVGGAAIDAYMAMTVPFVGWALHRARTPLRFTLAALLALGFAYACLITFSRGVYGSVMLPVLALGIMFWIDARTANPGAGRWLDLCRAAGVVAVVVLMLVGAFALAALPGVLLGVLATVLAAVAVLRRWPQAFTWRQFAGRGLAVALVVEVLAVAWLGSFLVDRVQHSRRDFGHRMEHWAQGLALRHGVADQWLGIGLGRLPAHLARFAPRHEFSGAAALAPADGLHRGVRLQGPATWPDLAGLFSLTQRVPPVAGPYQVEFDILARQPVGLTLTVCELHLLYERQCQGHWHQAQPAAGWQHVQARLQGPPLSRGPWWAPRQAVFLVSLTDVAADVHLTGFRLEAPGQPGLLRNGDFSLGLDHWQVLAQAYFLPWHIDNLYLELLVERGPAALLAFLALTLWTLVGLLRAGTGGQPGARGVRLAFAASLAGLMLVGAVSSVMDTGRPAFLALGVVAMSVAMARPVRAQTVPAAVRPVA